MLAKVIYRKIHRVRISRTEFQETLMFAEINEKDLVKDNQKEWSKKIIKKTSEENEVYSKEQR